MTVTLVLPGAIEAEILDHLALPIESAGVLLARMMEVGGGNQRLLARSMHWVPKESYALRTRQRMSIHSDGYVPALAAAELDNAIAIWFHTHPGDCSPLPSEYDLEVDDKLRDLFQLRTGSGIYGALIASLGNGQLQMSGFLRPESGPVTPIDRMWCVGERWRMITAFQRSQEQIPAMFDRNVRAFGPAIQHTLGSMRIAVVGTGGTGSAVAEQLVRLGVRHLDLIDADDLSLSNVTRVYGSTPRDVGRPKVEVVRDHLLSIAPNLDCLAVKGMITLKRIAKALETADLVFGCTDDNAGRLVLSRISTYLLTPVIDVGVLLSSDESGTLTGINGRVTILSPGAACLICRDRIDTARAAAELLSPGERTRLADEGYAPALGETEPAVVAFTTVVAAAAVGEFLERLIGFGPDDRPSEILLRMHEREVSGNRAEP